MWWPHFSRSAPHATCPPPLTGFLQLVVTCPAPLEFRTMSLAAAIQGLHTSLSLHINSTVASLGLAQHRSTVESILPYWLLVSAYPLRLLAYRVERGDAGATRQAPRQRPEPRKPLPCRSLHSPASSRFSPDISARRLFLTLSSPRATVSELAPLGKLMLSKARPTALLRAQ